MNGSRKLLQDGDRQNQRQFAGISSLRTDRLKFNEATSKKTFNSSGLEITSVDRNGLATTYTYSSNLSETITYTFDDLTTFTYLGYVLQTIEDPAHRTTTFPLKPDFGIQYQRSFGGPR
jgi:hypothetical protein